ncbi:MAG: 2Fe-2S iron-sulfur cluster-binding protein [Desulfobacterales bacterium]
MTINKVTFKILRYKPNHIDPPRFQEFTIRISPESSVLDGLEQIRLEQDNTLMYRHSCHHSSCGTCACRINGEEKLTCITKIGELGLERITLTPLERFRPMGDLVVDISPLYEDLSVEWSYLRKSEEADSTRRPPGGSRFTRFENCIECGACLSACPVAEKNAAFLGPAVLAALNCELQKSPQKEDYLMSLAGGKRGQHLCERALNCSRVCPTGVYPARHIADLRRMVGKNKSSKNK